MKTTDRQKRISQKRPRANLDRIGLGNQPVESTQKGAANVNTDDRARRMRPLGEIVAQVLKRAHRGEP